MYRGARVYTCVSDIVCVFNQRHVVTLEQEAPLFGAHLVLSQDLHCVFKVLMLLDGLLLKA